MYGLQLPHVSVLLCVSNTTESPFACSRVGAVPLLPTGSSRYCWLP